jgi:hypothetical protein
MDPTRRITHIAVAFITGVAGGAPGFHYSPTDFSSGFSTAANAPIETLNTNDAQTNLTQVSVTYGGITYPQSTYSLITNNNSNFDLQKAFSDYTIFTDSIRDRSGSLLSFSKWQANQIYVFKTRQGLNAQNSNCYVTVNCSTVPVNCNIFVLGLYDEWITITYDEFSRITEIRKDASPPISA